MRSTPRDGVLFFKQLTNRLGWRKRLTLDTNRHHYSFCRKQFR